MRIRKGLLVLAAVSLPIASVTMLEGTAFAKKVTGAGSTTCNVSGTITFNPPLTKAGSTSIKKEVTTVSSSLIGCTGGTPQPSGSIPLTVKPIKTKTSPKGSAGGTCGGFATNAGAVKVSAKISWPGEKPSKFTVTGLHVAINGMGEAGFTASAPVSGSYGGSGSLAVYLTQADSTAIATCSGSISTVHFDSTQSTTTL